MNRFIPWRRQGKRRSRRDTMPTFMNMAQRVHCQMENCSEVFEGDDPHDVWLRLSAHVRGHNGQD